VPRRDAHGTAKLPQVVTGNAERRKVHA